MESSLFTKAYFSKVRKGDILFTISDQVVYEVEKRSRKLVKLKRKQDAKVTWVTKMRFNISEYYFLIK
jgi:hypothetical protein